MTGRASGFRECTWFILRHPKAMRTEEGLIAHQRLISAVQFALLDSEGRESTLTAEQVDTWLFQHQYDSSFPGLHETYWQTAGTFQAALPVVPERDKFYPRQPQLVPRRVVNMGPLIELLQALLPPTARLGRLSRERRRLLDSLPFFILGVFGRVYGRHKGTACQLRDRVRGSVQSFGRFRRDKAGQFVRCVFECLAPPLNRFPGVDSRRLLRRLRTFCRGLYDLRSAIVHEGESRLEEFLFRGRPDEQPFLGYVWKARQLFAACVRARLGLLNPLDLAVVLDQLVSNEERLRRAHEAFGQGKADEALSLVTELRSYQTPEPIDLILAVWRDLCGLVRCSSCRAGAGIAHGHRRESPATRQPVLPLDCLPPCLGTAAGN